MALAPPSPQPNCPARNDTASGTRQKTSEAPRVAARPAGPMAAASAPKNARPTAVATPQHASVTARAAPATWRV